MPNPFEKLSHGTRAEVFRARPSRVATSPGQAAKNSIFRLQRAIGNQGMARLMENAATGKSAGAQDGEASFNGGLTAMPRAIQPKLTVNAPGDEHEQEANRVAEQVMRMPDGKNQGRLQMKAAGAGSAGGVEAPAVAHEALRSPGQPLDAATRTFMEPRFGYDFSAVRVHADGKAAESARAMNARAYTVGSNIVFSAGAFAPGTEAGQRLLSHELAHVVQQGRGGVASGVAQRAEDWNFTPADFSELKKNKGSLKFDSDSSWFPPAFQTNLLDTLNFVLDPARKKPATAGVSTADFFHGHIAMKGQKSTELNKLTGDYNKVGEEEYAKALGGSRINELTAKNLPAYKKAVEKTLPSEQAMLSEAAKLKDVVVIYHTYESNKPASMKYGSPDRNFITPLGGSPKPYSPPDPDSAGSWTKDYPTDILQFNFLVDEKGVIHVRPGFAESSRELSTITGKPEK